MKIAVVGSRDYKDEKQVRSFVRCYDRDTTIISGGARGVDTWAIDEAKNCGIKTLVFPADWQRYGKSAGYIRNQQIVEAADEVVAFWDGISKGTKHTISLSRLDIDEKDSLRSVYANVFSKALGSHLRYFRMKSGLAQGSVADTLEVPQSVVSQWESGRATPKYPTISAFCKLYGITWDSFWETLPMPLPGEVFTLENIGMEAIENGSE